MDDDFLDAFEDAVPEVAAEIVVAPPSRKLTREEERIDRIKEIEARIVEKYMSTLDGAADWTELDPENLASIPSGWVKKYGKKEAQRRHRIAQAAWMSAKDAPIGLKVAQQVVLGFAKAHAIGKAPRFSLNVKEIHMVDPQVVKRTKYDETEVDD